MYYIYGLVDPREPDHIRYIGQTQTSLKRRHKRHLSETLRHQRENKRLTYKEHWILTLLDAGIEPSQVVIEEVAENDDLLNDRETHWIAHYRSLEQAECNFKDGGVFSSQNMIDGWERRQRELGIATVAERKAALLAMPEGSPRPAKKHNMGLGEYTSKEKAYDAVFDAAIRARFPHWFHEDRVAAKKAEILSLPVDAQRFRGFYWEDYVNKSKSNYDAVFDAAVKSRFPSWFAIKTTDGMKYNRPSPKISETKTNLLAMTEGAERPETGTYLSNALLDYTSANKKHFDAVFNQQIRQKFPLWFKEDRVALNMQELMQMPVGTRKPRKDTPLGQALRNYTRVGGKSYRADFHREISERHPDWFVGKWYPKE